MLFELLSISTLFIVLGVVIKFTRLIDKLIHSIDNLNESISKLEDDNAQIKKNIQKNREEIIKLKK